VHDRPRRFGLRAAQALSLLALATAGSVYVVVAQHNGSPTRAAPPATSTPRPPAAPRPGTVQIASVAATDAPGGVRRVWIYRPGVADSASLPVVYFLHGLPGNYLSFASTAGKDLLDRLITSAAVKPFVLAAPDGNSDKASDPEWADSADGNQQIERFVIGALLHVVEGSHPRDRAHRFIMGFSMGGYGAMNLALHHPGLYDAVASVAGYFDTDDRSGVFGGNDSVVAANRPDRHLAAAHTLRVMLADGADDHLAATTGETARFATLLRRDGVTPYVDIQPGGHDTQYLRRELPRALTFLVG
jgi:S-formylglutathione hydrolase FrmB